MYHMKKESQRSLCIVTPVYNALVQRSKLPFNNTNHAQHTFTRIMSKSMNVAMQISFLTCLQSEEITFSICFILLNERR